MRCPDCGEDMNKGFLKGTKGLFFTRNREDSGLEDTSFSVDASGFKERLLHGSYLPAHYCPFCHLILTRRPNRLSDWEQVKRAAKRTIKKLKKEDF